MRAIRRSIVVVLVMLGAGCSSDGGDECSSPVEDSVYECFAGGGMPAGAVEEGSIEVATGREALEVVAEEQPLELMHGLQGGFHFEIRTRISGLDGGDPDSTDPDHLPVTMLTGYSESGERIDITPCGFFLAYDPGEEYDELPGVRLVIFNAETRPADGARVRIVAEILDRCGRYASDEVWVVTDD